MSLRSTNNTFPGIPESGGVVVTILYDEKSTGLRAKALFESVSHELCAQNAIEFEYLRIDLLSDPRMEVQLSAAIDRSAIVVLSLLGMGGLAAEVENWIDRWLQFRRSRSSALLLLLSNRHSPLADWKPAVARLRNAAHKNDVGFFFELDGAGAFVPSTVGRRPSVLARFRQEAADTSPTAHWGIKE